MANEVQLNIIRQGAETWNTWRLEHPEITRPDLRVAELSAAYLSDADLYLADLSGADLRGAILSGANLSGAHLVKADLRNADLFEADLSGSNLRVADLRLADVTGADLSGADLRVADLRLADLRLVNLNGADLSGANLGGANLTGADLRIADLQGVNLVDANLTDCKIGYTTFANVYLGATKGLETERHDAPSTIGIDTIYYSAGKIPEGFLRGAGVPEEMIAYARTLFGKPVEYYSCFISYSKRDEEFADGLRRDLQARGMRVWHLPEDDTWEKTVWGEIDQSMRIYDKLIVICSQSSLQSGPVLREIERGLQRENREHQSTLFPIWIDNYLFEQWQHKHKADVVVRGVSDFSGWDKDASRYRRSLDRLVKALQAE